MTKADTSFNPIHAENPTLQINTTKLEGMKFMEWSQSVKNLTEKQREVYIYEGTQI